MYKKSSSFGLFVVSVFRIQMYYFFENSKHFIIFISEKFHLAWKEGYSLFLLSLAFNPHSIIGGILFQ